MNATDVTEPCAMVQYGLMMCGSQKMEFRHNRKPIGWNAELRKVQFRYWKTEPSEGFLQILSATFPKGGSGRKLGNLLTHVYIVHGVKMSWW